jgi:hypothetical protein
VTGTAEALAALHAAEAELEVALAAEKPATASVSVSVAPAPDAAAATVPNGVIGSGVVTAGAKPKWLVLPGYLGPIAINGS